MVGGSHVQFGKGFSFYLEHMLFQSNYLERQVWLVVGFTSEHLGLAWPTVHKHGEQINSKFLPGSL